MNEGNLSLEIKSWFYGLVSTVAVVFLAFTGWVAISILQMQQEMAAMKARAPVQDTVILERFKRVNQQLDDLNKQVYLLREVIERNRESDDNEP